MCGGGSFHWVNSYIRISVQRRLPVITGLRWGSDSKLGSSIVIILVNNVAHLNCLVPLSTINTHA